MKYNAIEQEAIALCVTVEAINNIVNHSLLDVRPISEHPGESIVYFPTRVHQDLFLVRTLDFTKEHGSESLTGLSGSCLDILLSICKVPSFEEYDSIENLCKSVAIYKNWMDVKKTVHLWLPTLDVEASIEVTRLELLTISGNSSKHNISRLTRVCKIIETILSRNGYTVDLDQIPLALEDFREHLQENYFAYYGTQLAELINNLRWGIQDYLSPAFLRANKRLDDQMAAYTYIFPNDMKSEISRQWFWRLMNNVRSDPYIKRFRCWRCLNEESSLETMKRP